MSKLEDSFLALLTSLRNSSCASTLSRPNFQGSELGYYLIINYIEHQRSMVKALNVTNNDTNKAFLLELNISEDFLGDFTER
jgi:hypothetical protein